jgi:hypothetical protein
MKNYKIHTFRQNHKLLGFCLKRNPKLCLKTKTANIIKIYIELLRLHLVRNDHRYTNLNSYNSGRASNESCKGNLKSYSIPTSPATNAKVPLSFTPL